MAAKGPARASLRYAKAPLSPRYQWELHQLLGHCSGRALETRSKAVAYIGWKIKDRMEIDPRSILSVMNNRSSR